MAKRRQNFYGIRTPVDCDECGDENAARRRCMRCKVAVCYHHVCAWGHEREQEAEHQGQAKRGEG